jgi:tripeptide aminopeptidase
VHKFDVAKFGAEYAYTMDGSEVGELEYENFNAAGAVVKINGLSVHPLCFRTNENAGLSLTNLHKCCQPMKHQLQPKGLKDFII